MWWNFPAGGRQKSLQKSKRVGGPRWPLGKWGTAASYRLDILCRKAHTKRAGLRAAVSADARGQPGRQLGARLRETRDRPGCRDAVIAEGNASGKGTVARQPQRRTEEMLPGARPLCKSGHTHQGLKGCVLHEVIVQVAVGHHPVDLDAGGMREGEEEPQAGWVPGVPPGLHPQSLLGSEEGAEWEECT